MEFKFLLWYLSITRYTRFVLGEGLEKRNENFADEVKKQLG